MSTASRDLEAGRGGLSGAETRALAGHVPARERARAHTHTHTCREREERQEREKERERERERNTYKHAFFCVRIRTCSGCHSIGDKGARRGLHFPRRGLHPSALGCSGGARYCSAGGRGRLFPHFAGLSWERRPRMESDRGGSVADECCERCKPHMHLETRTEECRVQCVCVCACVRACVRACARACDHV